MRGKVLFYLPEDLETLLASIAVIQGYVHVKGLQFKLDAIGVVPEIWVHKPKQHLGWFISAIGPHHEVSYGYVPGRLEFDVVFCFDKDSAYRLGATTEMHLTQAFGTQLGIPVQAIPDLSMLKIADPIVDVGLYNFDGRESVKAWLVKEHPEKSWKILDVSDPPSLARLVVGMQSAATYLACAFKRGVVELVPSGKHPRWLSKWSHPGYVMLYGNLPLDHVTKAVEAVWERISVQASEVPQLETRTEHTIFGAESAVGLSAKEGT
jgi:hypothetical protein